MISAWTLTLLVALVFALVDLVQAKGRALTGWALVLVVVYLLRGYVG